MLHYNPRTRSLNIDNPEDLDGEYFSTIESIQAVCKDSGISLEKISDHEAIINRTHKVILVNNPEGGLVKQVG